MSRVVSRWRSVRWPGGALLLAACAIALVAVCAAEAGDAGIAWDTPIEVVSGEAYRGPWRMNRSDFRFVDDGTVAVDDKGGVAVAWADQARQDIFFRRYGPDGEPQGGAPVNISRSGDTFSWLPRVVLGGDHDVLVLWQEIIFSGGSHGGEILFARSTDGGRTFSPPLNLSSSPAGAGKGRLSADRWHNGSLDLARVPDGTLFAAWTEYEGRLWFRRSTDGGRTFTDAVRVAGGGDGAPPARGPSLAVAPDGTTVHLAWAVGERSDADIHVATSTDGGRSFGPARTVGASDGHSDAPKLAVDPQGTVHLVYGESPDGPEVGYHLRYSRRAADADRFEGPRQVGGLDHPRVSTEHFPHLAVDGRGHLVLLWEVFLDGRRRPQGLGIAHSRDGGRTFSPPARVPSEVADPSLGINGSQQGLLMRKLAASGAGRLAVVNSTFRPDASSHVWLLRGRIEADDEGS